MLLYGPVSRSQHYVVEQVASIPKYGVMAKPSRLVVGWIWRPSTVIGGFQPRGMTMPESHVGIPHDDGREKDVSIGFEEILHSSMYTLDGISVET